jgi:hypothetical protein
VALETGAKRPLLDLRGVELARWLSEITLTGAAALTAWPWGVRYEHEVIPLPLTAPQPYTSGAAGGYLGDLLPRIKVRSSDGRTMRSLHPEFVQLLPELMAPGGLRSDGLPRWDNSFQTTRAARVRATAWASGRFSRNTDEVIWDGPAPPVPPGGGTTVRFGHTPMTGVARNDRRIAREMLAAVACDIKGVPREQIGRRLLALGDHRKYSRDGPEVERSEGTDKAIVRGRSMLWALGAWPWAHVPQGRLPKRESWRAKVAFTEPLERWAREEIEHQQDTVLKARRAFDEPHEGARPRPAVPRSVSASDRRNEREAHIRTS